jgi:hypothetical protein
MDWLVHYNKDVALFRLGSGHRLALVGIQQIGQNSHSMHSLLIGGEVKANPAC